MAVPAELQLALLVAILPLVIQERLGGAIERAVHVLISHAEARAAAEAGRPRGALDEAGVDGEMAEGLREEPGHRRQEAAAAAPRRGHGAADVGERHGLGGGRPHAGGRKRGVHHGALVLRLRRAREGGGAELGLPLHRDAGAAGGRVALHPFLAALVHVHRLDMARGFRKAVSRVPERREIEIELAHGQWTNGDEKG